MRRIAFILLCVFVSVWVCAAAPKTPRPLPNMTIAAPLGVKPIRLAGYSGKVLLLAVFSTGCETCLATLQFLERLQKEFKGQDVQIVGAAADPAAASLLQPFIDRYKFTIPLGFLTETEARKLTDLNSPTDILKVPAFLFVDKKGTVRFQYPGDDDFFDKTEMNTRGVIQGLLRQ